MIDTNKKSQFTIALGAFIIASLFAVYSTLAVFNNGTSWSVNIIIVNIVIVLAWLFLLIKRMYKDMKQDWKHILCCGVLFLILAAGLANLVWNSNYLTLDFITNLATGITHRDTLLQETMANSMFVNGYASFMVNSSDFFNYHSFSSFCIGILAKIAFVDVSVGYNFLYPIFFIPIYVFLCFTVISKIRKVFKNSRELSLVDIVVAMVFFIGILPDQWASETSWYCSESNLVACVIALTYLCLVLKFYLSSFSKNKVMLNLMIFLVTPLFIIFSTTTKISVGLALCFCVMYYNFRIRFKSIKCWMINILYAITFLGIYFIPSLIDSPFSVHNLGTIVPLYHLRYNMAPNVLPYNLIFMYLFSAIAIWYGMRKAKNLKEIIFSKSYFIPETLFFVSFIGFAIANIFKIDGASGTYFVMVQVLLGMILVIAYDIPNKLLEKISLIAPSLSGKIKRTLNIGLILAAIIMCYNNQFPTNPRTDIGTNPTKGLSVMSIITTRMDSAVLATDEYRAQLATDFANGDYVKSIKGRLELIFGHNKHLNDPFYRNLEEIKNLTRHNEKDFYIFVDENAQLYDLYTNYPEYRVSFFYPGNTGVVNIGAMYTENGKQHHRNGDEEMMGWYNPNEPQPKMDLDLAIKKATEDGKKALIYLFEDEYKVIKIK